LRPNPQTRQAVSFAKIAHRAISLRSERFEPQLDHQQPAGCFFYCARTRKRGRLSPSLKLPTGQFLYARNGSSPSWITSSRQAAFFIAPEPSNSFIFAGAGSGNVQYKILMLIKRIRTASN